MVKQMARLFKHQSQNHEDLNDYNGEYKPSH